MQIRAAREALVTRCLIVPISLPVVPNGRTVTCIKWPGRTRLVKRQRAEGLGNGGVHLQPPVFGRPVLPEEGLWGRWCPEGQATSGVLTAVTRIANPCVCLRGPDTTGPVEPIRDPRRRRRGCRAGFLPSDLLQEVEHLFAGVSHRWPPCSPEFFFLLGHGVAVRQLMASAIRSTRITTPTQFIRTLFNDPFQRSVKYLSTRPTIELSEVQLPH